MPSDRSKARFDRRLHEVIAGFGRARSTPTRKRRTEVLLMPSLLAISGLLAPS